MGAVVETPSIYMDMTAEENIRQQYLVLGLPSMDGAQELLTFAFAALYTLTAMLIQSKAHTTAACILLVFALLFAGVHITSALNEPEYYSAYSYTGNGVTVEAQEERNPNYLTGTKRQVYEFLHDFTPGGQTLQFANMNTEHPAQLALYSSLILLAASACGILAFRRKDLK